TAEPAVFRPETAEWFARGPLGTRALGRFGGQAGLDFPVAAPVAALARMGIKFYSSPAGPPAPYLPSLLSPADAPFRRLDLAATAFHESQSAQARTGSNPVVFLGDSIVG